MIKINPGYMTKGIIYDTSFEGDATQRVYIRVPEIHGMPSEYIDTQQDGDVYTPDEDLPIARVAVRTAENDYAPGDIVSVTFPTGDLSEIYVTGILCKAPTESSSEGEAGSGILGAMISSIISKFKIFPDPPVITPSGTGSYSGDSPSSSSGASYSANVSAEFKGYFQCPIQEGYNGISSPFGPRGGKMHSGIDIRAAEGTPIHAAADGVIVKTQTGQKNNKGAEGTLSWGNYVKIHHGNINGRSFHTLYAHQCHLGTINGAPVTSGMNVKKGDVIGYVGDTGNSYGNHLHFEVYDAGTRKNPQNYVQIP